MRSIFLILLALGSTFALAQQPEELGRVDWVRNFDQGLAKAQEENKPVFLLFQEVPGCGTCKGYGQQVLGHPLIVEAIEELFVPVAIYNNAGGHDRAVLQRYGEPTWNNPVVRIVDAQGKDVIPRVSRDYSRLGVVEAMGKALLKEGKPVPGYLQVLWKEWSAQARLTKTATFSMYCFWTGEKTYGAMDGVISTQAGFMHGREVVSVEYDPEQVSYEDLLRQGAAGKCADQAYTHNAEQATKANDLIGADRTRERATFRSDHTPKYYLAQTDWKYVPMTPMQATKVNARLGQGQRFEDLLSPRQLARHAALREAPKAHRKNAIGEPIEDVWYAAGR